MSKLTREDILKLAGLSKLKLSEQEIAKFQTELSEILGYVEMLDTVDTADEEPTYQVSGLITVTREDKVKDYQAKPEELLKSAPAVKDGQYQVKRVL